MGRQRHDLDVPAIVAAYQGGEAPSSIAKRLGVTGQTIRNRLYAAGVQMRRGGGSPAELPMDRVAAEYGRGDSLPVLGRRYGKHAETIRRRLLRHGVQIRDPEAGQKLRYGQHGDVAALAGEVGVSVDELLALLLKHGFIY